MQRDSGYVSHSRPKSKHEGLRCRVLALENAHICSANRGGRHAQQRIERPDVGDGLSSGTILPG